MVGVIILTFLMTVLFMTVLFLIDSAGKQNRENNRLMTENDDLKHQIYDYRDLDRCRREQAAYDRGLYDGRQTDTLYRNVLRKYSSRDQVNVMMNGENSTNAR